MVDLVEPRYDQSLTKSMFSIPATGVGGGEVEGGRAPNFTRDIKGCDLENLAFDFTELNTDQQRAVERVISAKDYALLQGLPGTGKSSTIVFIAKLLLARHQRVLITSYTHTAVDNLLMKLKEEGVGVEEGYGDVARVGYEAKTHENVKEFLVENIAKGGLGGKRKVGTKELKSAIDYAKVSPSQRRAAETNKTKKFAAQVVGVTTLTVGSAASSPLIGQHFDFVIVDEAGQISQPAILSSLALASKFVLVGDQMQLPPIVKSQAASTGGFSVSLLQRMAEPW